MVFACPKIKLAAALRAEVSLLDFQVADEARIGIAYGLSPRPVITGLTMTRRP